jgi:hypothetical protein
VWLLLITPDADPVVGAWRAEHDSAARHGIPAHVTVRTPFLPPEQWAGPELSQLEVFLPLPVTLARLEDRPGALVIVAEPDDELREITDATTRMWPTLPPHKASIRPFAYHATVVRTEDPRVRSAAAEAIAPYLPLRVTGTEMWAAVEDSATKEVRHAVAATSPPL